MLKSLGREHYVLSVVIVSFVNIVEVEGEERVGEMGERCKPAYVKQQQQTAIWYSFTQEVGQGRKG